MLFVSKALLKAAPSKLLIAFRLKFSNLNSQKRSFKLAKRSATLQSALKDKAKAPQRLIKRTLKANHT